MAAESPIRTKSNAGHVVHPQHVTDPTILDGVAGFINDFVPTAYNLPTDNKDQIQWARFEQIGQEELNNCSDFEKLLPPPMLLTLGYITGIQIWAVPATGEAKELLSWRHGAVKVLTILPHPEKIGTKTTSDAYAGKRPLIALCDNVAPGNDYCSLSFISLKTSEQVKLIKFKNPILDVVANKRSVVVTFVERIAIFDAFTFEDRATVTTCYLSPGIFPNPIALGTRWLAYAENKLIPSRRSSGGNDGEGVQSYTATVLHAAKSLGRGLRELSDAVASSLTGNQHKPGTVVTPVIQADILQKGVVTIIDIEKPAEDDSLVAHFTAQKEAIVCLKFDPSGLLLLTADKRGYDFHLFRIQPHPAGPALAAVHHLYILHRGDTTARVQDMSFSPDSRWVTVSTLRGTTHVFPVTPYGGNVGVRTHATPHVVNKMSRFHRSAGLTAEGRSNSPVSVFETPSSSNVPYQNPRLPPYPHPTVVQPLAQIRQPLFIQNTVAPNRPAIIRQRSGSSSDDNSQVALRVTACFAPARAWIESPTQTRETVKPQVKPVESLFIMSLHGSLIQYDLDPRSTTAIPKEKVCDDTLIELGVTAKAQWVLQRMPTSKDVQLPLSLDGLQLVCPETTLPNNRKLVDAADDKWLSQVEIVTHAGPHRRLWMGPQFTFKTYNNGSGTSLNIMDTQVVEIGRSKPVNMPIGAAYPILIEAGSVSSCEPSPKLLDTLQRNFEEVGGTWTGELQLKEDLADAMLESPGVRDAGGRCVIVSMKTQCYGGGCVAKVVNPLGMVVTVQSDDDSDPPDAHGDEIIHENCDEALFRPVVASKAVVFAEPKNVRSKVATNVLHHNKVPPKNKTNNREQTVVNNKNKKQLVDVASIEESVEVIPDNKEATVDFLHDSFFDANEACQDIEVIKEETSFACEFETEILNRPVATTIDVFDSDVAEVAPSTSELIKLSISDKDKEKEVVSSSEETPTYEYKKPRKPKAKLGVRISNAKCEDREVSPVIAIPMTRTWSSVASATKCDAVPELPPLDDFTFSLPLMDYSKAVKDTADLICIEKSEDTLKVDKNSDENSSSQTETTESDDSSKIPPVIMDTEEDMQLVEVKPKTNSNKSKKSKKKRR